MLQIFATPMYEFLDTYVAHKLWPALKTETSSLSFLNLVSRFTLRGMYLIVSTFMGALLPFFGDFIALTGSMAAFTLQGGLIHHMIIQVPNLSIHVTYWYSMS